MVGHERLGLVERQLEALEGLVGGDDLAHLGVDALQVVVGEGRPAGQLEVVVEAVLDRRTAGEGRAGPQLEHRLGQHVGGGVTDVLERVGVAVGEDAHLRTVGQRSGQVDRLAVGLDHQRRLGQTRADVGGQVGAGGTVGQGANGSVGQRDGELGHALHASGGPRRALNRVPTAVGAAGWAPAPVSAPSP